MKQRTHEIDGRSIRIYDDAFTAAEKIHINDIATKSYYVLERESSETQEHRVVPRSLKSSYNIVDVIRTKFFENDTVISTVKELGLRVSRVYVNLVTSNDVFKYHVDGSTKGSYTGLYYINTEWDNTWEGETHFSDEKMEDILFSSSFIPGRYVLFDATIPHKSSQPSFNAKYYRLVMTVKYSSEGDENWDNSYDITDFYYDTDVEVSSEEKLALDYIKVRTHKIPHSGTSFWNHLHNTYLILKNFGMSKDVCLAGLFHSVYGTEFYQSGVLVGEEDVIGLIGEESNELVKIFSEPDRDRIIMDNLNNMTNKKHIETLYILYANLIEQAHRIPIDQTMLSSIKNKIIEREQDGE